MASVGCQLQGVNLSLGGVASLRDWGPGLKHYQTSGLVGKAPTWNGGLRVSVVGIKIEKVSRILSGIVQYMYNIM